jgi:type IX secretion system PorP/SprF family membrane protein
VNAVFSGAQDIHFSQYNASLLNLSPAFTGLFDGDYRFGAIYRSQWQSVPVSYSTFSMHGERRLKPSAFKKDMVGVGLLFNSDRAGDARYGSTQIYLNGSYIFLGKPDSSLIISMGTNVGWSQVSFDYSKMTFDNQFDGSLYNRSLSSGEHFNFVQKSFADVNLGGMIQFIASRRHKFAYGITLNHLNSPVISYQGNDLSRLDLKVSNYLAYSTPLNGKTDLVSEALVSNQGKNFEVIPHISLKYAINKSEMKAVSGGVCYRARDAVVLRFGYYYKTLQSGISYDINISNFSPATNRRGAFEIYLNYVLKIKPAFVARRRGCPVFM